MENKIAFLSLGIWLLIFVGIFLACLLVVFVYKNKVNKNVAQCYSYLLDNDLGRAKDICKSCPQIINQVSFWMEKETNKRCYRFLKKGDVYELWHLLTSNKNNMFVTSDRLQKALTQAFGQAIFAFAREDEKHIDALKKIYLDAVDQKYHALCTFIHDTLIEQKIFLLQKGTEEQVH